MRYLLQALNSLGSVERAGHLSHREALEEEVLLAYQATREAARAELELLKKTLSVSFWVGLASIALLFVGIIMAVAGLIDKGMLLCAAGLLGQILPLILYRRISASRHTLKELLPRHRDLFGVLVAIDAVGHPGEADSEIRKARSTTPGPRV